MPLSTSADCDNVDSIIAEIDTTLKTASTNKTAAPRLDTNKDVAKYLKQQSDDLKKASELYGSDQVDKAVELVYKVQEALDAVEAYI